MQIKGTRLRSLMALLSWTSILVSPMFAMIMAGLVLSLICIHLKLGNVSIGVVNAIPSIVLPFQVWSALVVMRTGKRHSGWMSSALVSRLAVVLLAPVLYYFNDDKASYLLPAFFVLFFVAHLGHALSMPLWFSWVGDLIPERESAAFWGKRNTITFVAGLVTSLAMGVILELNFSTNVILSTLVAVGGFSALLEIYAYRKVPPGEITIDTTTSFVELSKGIFANRNFRAFTSYNAIFAISVFLFIPFLFIHLSEIVFSNISIQIFLATLSVGAVLGSMFCSNLAPAIGYKNILLLSTILKALGWVFYIFVTKETPYILILLFYTFDGFTAGILMTSNFALLTTETVQKTRGLITAIYFSLLGIAALCASVASGVLMDLFVELKKGMVVNLLPFHFLMILSIAIATLSILFLVPYQGRVQGSTWNTVSTLFEGNPVLSFFRLVSFRGKDSLKERIDFISRNRSSLFVQETIEATHDASVTVREAAVRSLGRMKGDASIDVLRSLLRDEDSGLSILAARSLGDLRAVTAVDDLHASLESPNAYLCATAAWALAQIGDRTSLLLLKEHIIKEQPPFVGAALADSISHFKDLSIVPVVLPRFKETLAQGIRVQYLVALANMLGGVGEFYRLVATEYRQPGSGVSKLSKSIQRAVKKQHHTAFPLETLLDSFDNDEFGTVVRVLFEFSYQLYYPNLNLEKLTSKKVWDWNNTDFEKALGNSKPLITHTGPTDYSLWVLTVLNIRSNEKDRCTKEEALLAMYLFKQIC